MGMGPQASRGPTPAVADPGFPVGEGQGSIRGSMDLQSGCFLLKMYAKTKEFGPRGHPAAPPGQPMPWIWLWVGLCSVLGCNHLLSIY